MAPRRLIVNGAVRGEGNNLGLTPAPDPGETRVAKEPVVAIQPVTYRPITAIKPVSRKPDEEALRKVTERKRPRRDRPPEPGLGENLDTWV